MVILYVMSCVYVETHKAYHVGMIPLPAENPPKTVPVVVGRGFRGYGYG